MITISHANCKEEISLNVMGIKIEKYKAQKKL
jgi:hypothetical protein